MKQLLIMIALLVLTSCSKSLYYSYTDGNDYYSLEVTPKNEEIYRAKSDKYKNDYVYIYMPSASEARNILISGYNENDYTVMSFWQIYYLSEEKITGCDVFDKKGKVLDIEVNMHFHIRQDSLIPKYRDLDLDFTYYKEGDFLGQDVSSCIKDYNKNFLPPYMLKTDKIDYNKLQTGNYTKKQLKYPHKVKRKN